MRQVETMTSNTASVTSASIAEVDAHMEQQRRIVTWVVLTACALAVLCVWFALWHDLNVVPEERWVLVPPTMTASVILR